MTFSTYLWLIYGYSHKNSNVSIQNLSHKTINDLLSTSDGCDGNRSNVAPVLAVTPCAGQIHGIGNSSHFMCSRTLRVQPGSHGHHNNIFMGRTNATLDRLRRGHYKINKFIDGSYGTQCPRRHIKVRSYLSCSANYVTSETDSIFSKRTPKPAAAGAEFFGRKNIYR